LEVDFLAGGWRRGAQSAEIEVHLLADRGQRIKAVMVVHNETSTAVIGRIHEVRRAIDRAKYPGGFHTYPAMITSGARSRPCRAIFREVPLLALSGRLENLLRPRKPQTRFTIDV
jgi:hypothetical protein